MRETFFYKDEQGWECHCLIEIDLAAKCVVFTELQENRHRSVINCIECLAEAISKKVSIPVEDLNIYEVSLPFFGFSASNVTFPYTEDGRPLHPKFDNFRSTSELYEALKAKNSSISSRYKTLVS